ncbi:nuclear transport factor 2 family protein [Pseudonocardia nigra]|uniref:nuclear transport factor 2 family protein n=1 Tax=Pseudonocardia nigra TaxID=1921578 RepID=UPI001FE92916|nr:nuclear transport factor 2 family protein [Pseudonocardia nigra]
MDDAALPEVLARHLDAFNRQDLDTLLDGFTADARWVTGTSSFRGRAELADLFRGAFPVSPTLRPLSVLAAGDRVAAELREYLVHDGVPAEFAIAGFYRIESGRIAAAKIYREGSADLPRSTR